MEIGSYLDGIENKVYSSHGILKRQAGVMQENLHPSITFFSQSDNLFCHQCGHIDSPFYFDRAIKLKKKNFDYSITYEGKFIVSKKFRDFCLESKYDSLLFLSLEQEPDFFYFIVLGPTIKVDLNKSKITIKETCNVCSCREVFGGLKLHLNVDAELKDGFYCTDLYWRSHYVFGQRVVVGLETEKILRLQKFKGLYFKKVYK